MRLKLITDEYRPRKVKRTFPRTHTFKVTAVFNRPIRVAHAQNALCARLAVHDQFAAGFKITKVARTKRCR